MLVGQAIAYLKWSLSFMIALHVDCYIIIMQEQSGAVREMYDVLFPDKPDEEIAPETRG